MSTVTETFGSMVFNDSVMRARLPKEVFKQVQLSMKDGKRLNSDAAAAVSSYRPYRCKDTHFRHWCNRGRDEFS